MLVNEMKLNSRLSARHLHPFPKAARDSLLVVSDSKEALRLSQGLENS